MVFGNGVRNIQAAAYDGASTVVTVETIKEGKLFKGGKIRGNTIYR